MEDGSLQRKLLDSVCEEFDHVILAIASGGAVEAGFLSEYDSIDAVLWIGAPGPRGYSVLAGILAGEINPSGRTTDTWPSSFSSNPAVAGSELSYYANINGQYALHISVRVSTLATAITKPVLEMMKRGMRKTLSFRSVTDFPIQNSQKN